MKKIFQFKSIYGRITFFTVGLWWLMNTFVFGLLARLFSKKLIQQEALSSQQLFNFLDLDGFKLRLGILFLLSALLGTFVILLIVRDFVKPIKSLARASEKVSEGNFDVYLKTKRIDEVGQLIQQFNQMVEALKSIDIMRRDFVSSVSHEFRTPMTSIRGFAQLLEDPLLTEEKRKEYSSIIVKESQRLESLSNHLLELSLLENQPLEEVLTPIHLDEQIRQTILILEGRWQSKEIQFKLKLEPVMFCGHEDRLHQVWLNLLDNAIKFSSPKGCIEISLKKLTEGVLVKIKDFGLGISAEDLEKIFDSFYVCDNSRTNKGNGLGLVITKKIIEKYGGRIKVESSLNNGSEFSVYLPNKEIS